MIYRKFGIYSWAVQCHTLLTMYTVNTAVPLTKALLNLLPTYLHLYCTVPVPLSLVYVYQLMNEKADSWSWQTFSLFSAAVVSSRWGQFSVSKRWHRIFISKSYQFFSYCLFPLTVQLKSISMGKTLVGNTMYNECHRPAMSKVKLLFL